MNAPHTGPPGPLLLVVALLAGCGPGSVGGSGSDASPGDQGPTTPPDASASAMLAAHDAVRVHLWVCNYVPPGNVEGERPY